ncbi:MAG TPA: hypothetical protein PK799_14360 [Rhodocyclaceae bacterium]|nr:hypothetical protein [Rhodocyclaceae bacterium]
MRCETAVLGPENCRPGAAGVAASAIGWALARFVFSLDYLPSVLPVLFAVPLGIAGVTLAGWLGTRGLLRQPALTSIRALA